MFYSGNVNPFTGGLLQSNALDPDLDAPADRRAAARRRARPAAGVRGRPQPDLPQDHRHPRGRPPGLRRPTRTRPPTSTRSAAAHRGRTTSAAAPRADPACPTGTAAQRPVLHRHRTTSSATASARRNGTFLYNGDREQEYKGASLVFNKRLANRWMLRGNVTYSDWTWSKVPDSDIDDPTLPPGRRQPRGRSGPPGLGHRLGLQGRRLHQQQVGVQRERPLPDRSRPSVGLQRRAQPERPPGLSGPVLPRGSSCRPTTNGASANVQVTRRPDTFRLDNIHIVDARVEKEFTFSDFGLTLGVDCFNVFNEAYVLQRNHRLARPPRTTSARSPARASSVSARA